MEGFGRGELALQSETYADGHWMSVFYHTESIQKEIAEIRTADFATVIRLAVTSFTSMQKEASDIQYKDSLEKEVALQTARIQKKAEEDVDRVLQEVTRLKTTITELQVQKESIKEMQARGEAEYRASLRAIQEDKNANHAREIDRLHSYTQELQKQIVEAQARSQLAFQASLQMIEGKYEKDMERVREDARIRLAEMQAIVSKAEEKRGSCDIGSKGEREFEELVSEFTHWGNLENTAKQPHSADWNCNIRKCKVMFEVKNYTSDIPKAEITKFEKDMALHADVPLGVFVALKTRIQGKKFNDFITIDWSPASQMMVYVSSLYTQDIKSVFAFLDVCIDIAFRAFRLAQNKDETDEAIRLQEKFLKAKALIGNELLRTAEWMKEVKIETKTVTDLLIKQGVVNQEKINYTRTTLMSVLGVLDEAEEEKVGDKEGVGEKDKEKEKPKRKSKLVAMA
jgi:hypothetical protein